MKKINWQVRLKKKSFWVAIVSAVALFVNNITGAFGFDYSANIEQGVSIITSALTLLAGLGIIVDPTTKGIRDSEKATEYTTPRDDKDPSQFLQWEIEGNTLTPEEYDTREPFSDDSDEVIFDVAEYEEDEELMRGESKFHDDEVLGLDKEVK